MTSSWDRFEEVLDTRDIAALRGIEVSLDTETEGTESDRQELRAVVLAVLASESEVTLSSAQDAASAAAQAGRGNWPYFYLAEAAARFGDDELVIAAVDRIDPEFFPARDLRWRQARCQELRAAAVVKLRRWDEARAAVEELAADYAAHGEVDDYASPRDLIQALLKSGATGRPLLVNLSMSIDMGIWVDPALREQVESAVGDARRH